MEKTFLTMLTILLASLSVILQPTLVAAEPKTIGGVILVVDYSQQRCLELKDGGSCRERRQYCEEDLNLSLQDDLVVRSAAIWTIQRLKAAAMIDPGIGLDVVNTCGGKEEAQWRLIHSLSRYSSDTPPHVVLASTSFNSELKSAMAGFPLLSVAVSVVEPASPHSNTATAARLVRLLGWRQVGVMSSEYHLDLNLASALHTEDVCLLNTAILPGVADPKDNVTNLISRVVKTAQAASENDRTNVVLRGKGDQVARVVRNMAQLNLDLDILALPWDGPLVRLAGTTLPAGSKLFALVPTYTLMADFVRDVGESGNPSVVYDHPLAWQVVKSLYGLLVLQDSTIEDSVARDGLNLSRSQPGFRVESYDLTAKSWRTVGRYEDGEFAWLRLQIGGANSTTTADSVLVSSSSASSPPFVDANSAQCRWCRCLNDVDRGGVGLLVADLTWRYDDLWVTILSALAGAGLLACLAVSLFLCVQCGQVLEGGQATSLLLVAATAITFTAILPYCFQPGSIDCEIRRVAPGASLTLLISILLSRSILLATSDTDGLPGHASGAVQFVLLVLMLIVEGTVLGLEPYTKQTDPHESPSIFSIDSIMEVDYMDPTFTSCAYKGGWLWLGLSLWPGILLLVQTLLSPIIWKSRRNYKEGMLFSLAAIAIVCVTAVWVTVYIICTEIYGDHWEDIAVCAGLVATATAIVLVVFIPKVYLMNIWGTAGGDISLHLPGTTTSTLHTDTIDYLAAQSVYKTPVDEHTIAYVNLNPLRLGGGKQGDQLRLGGGKQEDGSSPPARGKEANPYGSTYVMGTRSLLEGKGGSQPGHHRNGFNYNLDRNTEPASNLSWEPFPSQIYGRGYSASDNGLPTTASQTKYQDRVSLSSAYGIIGGNRHNRFGGKSPPPHLATSTGDTASSAQSTLPLVPSTKL